MTWHWATFTVFTAYLPVPRASAHAGLIPVQ